jgi:DNA-binding transcriptional LysR family regulator
MANLSDPFQLNSVALFCKAAEAGNFTAAAEALGITPAAVSRSIGRLEARLGVKLFARTTRRVSLTDDGRAYFNYCQPALQQLQEAARVVTGNQAKPGGTVRLSVPTTYGHHRVLPLLPKFLRRYPDIELEVSVSNRNVDFVEEGFDVAVRMGALPDSRLIAHQLESAALCLFASPAYLKRARRLRTLDDLDSHERIQFMMPGTGRPLAWSFRGDRDDPASEIEYSFDSRLRVYDDVLAGVTLAEADGGIFQSYRFIVAGALRSGALLEVLPAFAGRARPFSVLYPHNRHMATRVRVLVDFLRKECAR